MNFFAAIAMVAAMSGDCPADLNKPIKVADGYGGYTELNPNTATYSCVPNGIENPMWRTEGGDQSSGESSAE